MATAEELVRSRKTNGGTNPTHERVYIITEAADYQDAIDAVIAIAPTDVTVTTSGGSTVTLPMQTPTVEPLELDEGWTATVEYALTSGGALNTSVVQDSLAESATEFTIGAGTRHVSHSLSTELTSRAPGVTSDDYERAINVGREGRVEGVDIVVPTFRWKESYELPPTFITAAYIQKLYTLTGKVNRQGWRGYEAREVLFAGATGKRQGNGNWKLDYEFWYEKSVADLEIGDCTGIDKAGWDYLWVETEPVASGQSLVPTPKVVRVERVYEEADLYDLEIGT